MMKRRDNGEISKPCSTGNHKRCFRVSCPCPCHSRADEPSPREAGKNRKRGSR
jgi:hypothetical protein